ncbi:hypothetical protein BJY14_006709 [Actinomadura luteofluorescens]|uniref:Uncharacterized protein n=1 Tax=Actinomadura luteofluorescens TaxID=46163 RepID=A0A7Y9EMX2_9ACTN|nr:hypothetical protein [Actinomadura luteofluorescens]NYD50726.1 hypothetical protein [Actinomadura luteofluorescens]
MADKRDKWAEGTAHQSEANKTVGIEEESSDAYRSGPQDQQKQSDQQ